MSEIRWHLAQVNIARLRAPLNDSQMVGLAARVDEMNVLAERGPGYVWRLRGEKVTEENLHVFSSYVVPFDLAFLFYNLSGGKVLSTCNISLRTPLMRRSCGTRVNGWLHLNGQRWHYGGFRRAICLPSRSPPPYAFTFRRTFKTSDAH